MINSRFPQLNEKAESHVSHRGYEIKLYSLSSSVKTHAVRATEALPNESPNNCVVTVTISQAFTRLTP